MLRLRSDPSDPQGDIEEYRQHRWQISKKCVLSRLLGRANIVFRAKRGKLKRLERGPIAQLWLERAPDKREVSGSSPLRPTIL